MKAAGVAIATLLVVCLAVPLAACGDGEGGEPPAGKIAFQSDRDGNRELYVMNVDGSGSTRLTANPAADRDSAWSP